MSLAQISFDAWGGLMQDLEAVMDLPEGIADAMLNAEAEIIVEATRDEASKIGMYEGYDSHNNTRDTSSTNYLPGQERSYSTGELARSVRSGKMKVKDGQRHKFIYFAGSRKRGKTRTRNAEIAFLNEYGTRTINARRFIWVANEKSADAAAEAAAKVYDDFLKSKNL